MCLEILLLHGCGGQKRFGIPFWLVGAAPILEPDVHLRYGILTHGHTNVVVKNREARTEEPAVQFLATNFELQMETSTQKEKKECTCLGTLPD